MKAKYSIGKLSNGSTLSVIECESANKCYRSVKEFTTEGARKDYRFLNGKEYHYGSNSYSDRIFNELHCLWLENETLIASGDYNATRDAINARDIR